ncbi:phytanoyl-CoA dioxygenase family protein [bacterium AH-315-E10]|nr:phytanoyl-CoA dioxygenase family protein [bacterium AH-315-E10]
MKNILSEIDHDFFNENGYVIVKNAAPAEDCDATVQFINDYLGGGHAKDWYQPPYNEHGFMPLYFHQTMWNNRQNKMLYRSVCEIISADKLWVSIDRVCAKLPSHPDHPTWGSEGFLHWDCNPEERPDEVTIQGVLVLADTTEDMGGFQCLPGCHKLDFLKDFLALKKTNPDARPGQLAGINGWPEATRIPAEKGDYIIWNRLLPHGNAANDSRDKIRYCQYILYHTMKDRDDRKEIINLCYTRHNHNMGNDPYDYERQTPQAELTELGKKLLGELPWD